MLKPEQQALDLIMDIVQRAKQGKVFKKSFKKLQALAKQSLQVKKMYDNLVESTNQRLEEEE